MAAQWTEERVAKLKQMAAEGYSASQIAAELGGVTRNGVIGKIHRKNITWNSGSKNQVAGAVAANRRRRAQRAARSGPISLAAPPPKPTTRVAIMQQLREEEPAMETTEVAPPRAMPSGAPAAIVALQSGDCRWPIGDARFPDFHFCGAPALHPMPYCGTHCRMAYDSPSERRGQREAQQRESRALAEAALRKQEAA